MNVALQSQGQGDSFYINFNKARGDTQVTRRWLWPAIVLKSLTALEVSEDDVVYL